jgi:hypothetical protein
MNAPLIPPIDWYRNPELAELTPLTVLDSGQVYGHVAGWGQSHISFPGRRISPPKSRTDYRHFMTGSLRVQDGDEARQISVGRLIMGCPHAGTQLSARDAFDFYANSGAVAATVCTYEDEHGIAIAGSVEPDIDELTLRRFRACGLSGDWRNVDGHLEMVGVISVGVQGFPIPRARVASGAPLALVAAGMVQPAAQFGRRVVDGWVAPKVDASAGFDADAIAAAIVAKLEENRATSELAARHTALVTELDDTPIVAAALLAEIDDSPQRAAALLAELDDEDDFLSGMPPQLKESWLRGEVAARIRWGTDGDFDRCVTQAREHDVPAAQREGLCNNLHREALGGKAPGKHGDA